MPYLIQEQFLPITLEQAWEFFATPKNLDKVTPAELQFHITSPLPEKMYEGLMITYKIKPMLNISIECWTKIEFIKELEYFVDEQVKGPYKIWHHEHHFKKADNGVMMKDILYYDVGKSFIGWIAGKLFVNKKVNEIFSYRKAALENYFKS